MPREDHVVLSVDSLPGTLLPPASVSVTFVSRPPSARTFTGTAGFTLMAPSAGVTVMCAGGAALFLSPPPPEHAANSAAAVITALATRQAARDRRILGLRCRPLDAIEPRSTRCTRTIIRTPCLTLAAHCLLPGRTGRHPSAYQDALGGRGGSARTHPHQRIPVRRHADRCS